MTIVACQMELSLAVALLLLLLVAPPACRAMVPEVKLNNGQILPVLGLGTWKSAPGDVKTAVKEAIKCGYRHLDCAACYENEAEIGQALKECFEEGLCKREDLFVTSKLWIDSKKREDVLPALKESLSKLQVDYLDMYLVHWPVTLKKGEALGSLSKDSFHTEEEVPVRETWEQMELAVEEGLTKGIGVSNFSPKKIKVLLECATIPPAINQVELHPFLQRKEKMSFCLENGIHVTAYSPLGSTDRPPALRGENEPSLLENTDIVAIAEKHGCSAAQVLLRWSMQYGCSVIPKSTNPERLKQNLESVKIQLDDEDMEKIAALNRDFRFVDGLFWCLDGSHITYENLWDGA